MAIQNLQNFLQSLGQRVGTGFERIGATTDPRLSPEEQRFAGIQNLSQALRRTGATLSGDPQRMALQAQEDEALRQRRLAEDQKRRMTQIITSNPNIPEELREPLINNPNAYANFTIADLERQRKDKKETEFRSITSSINRNDYESPRLFYGAIGDAFQKEGYTDKAIEYFKLAQPQTMDDIRKDLIDANKTETKTFNATNKGIKNFQQLLDAANSADGAASYALMVKFIRQLDDSVVKEGEVRSFGSFQGALENLKIQFEKIKGDGFTPEVKANMINLAGKTAQRLFEDYNNYKVQKNQFYNTVGLPSSLVFSGLDFNLGDLDLSQKYTSIDFEIEDITGELDRDG